MTAATALIGPNALTQTAAALAAAGPSLAPRVFEAAGLGARLAAPPTEMVPAAEASALNAALFRELGPAAARPIAREAGLRTGAYLLAHRIPPLAQTLIRAAPRRLGKALLYGAMRRHAWTFAGGGAFDARIGSSGDTLILRDCPLAAHASAADAPVCALYEGVFERLLRRLIDDRIRVRETQCAAAGGARCVFEAWRSG